MFQSYNTELSLLVNWPTVEPQLSILRCGTFAIRFRGTPLRIATQRRILIRACNAVTHSICRNCDADLVETDLCCTQG